MPASKPLLTFDVDGVLCRPPFGINPGKGIGKRRERPGKKGVLWWTERWRYRLRKPMPSAVEGFRALSERFECHVLSARSDAGSAYLSDWFERWFGRCPPLHLRPHWRETSAAFKARMALELRPLAHFEDDPHTAAWLAELVPAVFLLDWSRNRWLEAPAVHRVHRIIDALPVLEALTDAQERAGPGRAAPAGA